MDIAQIRQDYSKKKLSKKHAHPDAVSQFRLWIDEAVNAKCPEPTAMVLSTVSEYNTAASRVVLLKGIESGGFVFFTNYKSRKGNHMEMNPSVSALFFWPELERQVNIEGKVTKCSTEYSDQYFNSRPWKSRIGAIISPQSQVIESRNVIKKAFVSEAAKHLSDTIPRPEHWGGYIIMPRRIEFWQGRPSRLHDRIVYNRESDSSWSLVRLAP